MDPEKMRPGYADVAGIEAVERQRPTAAMGNAIKCA